LSDLGPGYLTSRPSLHRACPEVDHALSQRLEGSAEHFTTEPGKKLATLGVVRLKTYLPMTLAIRGSRARSFMYLIAIAWLYVALMMALAEATSPQGGLFGAVITFLLYGVAPMALVMYLVGTPARRKARKAAEALADAQAQVQVQVDAEAQAQAMSALRSVEGDGRHEAPAEALPTVGKEP
jgi:hypothetical protein